MGDGQVRGGIHYGSLLNVKDYLKEDLIRNKCSISNDSEDNLDFESIEKRVIELSNELGQVVSNAKVEIHENPNRRLVLSKDIKDYVINVDENTFKATGGYAFEIQNPDGLKPEEVTIIFNVKGKSFTLSNAGFDMNEFGDRIIWNMPEVTEAKFNSADIYGLLLAPKANVVLNNGNLFGKLVSSKLTTGSVSIKKASFNGCVPNPKVRYDDETVCNDENIESKEINSDIVFIFDESISMCNYIEALRKKLQTFIDDLEDANANARFAVVGFGGKPRIYSAFTSNVTEVNKAFEKLNCKQGGQESGLEAIRMFLNKSSKFLNENNEEFEYDIEGLAWRSDSTKTIILVTDEDSDLPHYEENRNDLQKANGKRSINVSKYNEIELTETDANKFVGFPYYGDISRMPKHSSEVYFEPAFSPAILTTVNSIRNFYRSGTPLVLSEPYQKEVDETAKLIINENIQLYMLINDDLASSQGELVSNSQYNSKNPYWAEEKSGHWAWFVYVPAEEDDDSSTITAQYGNPLIDNVENSEYERDKILSTLIEKKQEKSLQGQILNSKGFCRAFNMKDFINQDSEKMVNQFYKTVVSSVQTCSVIKVPKKVIEEEEESTSDLEADTTTEDAEEVTAAEEKDAEDSADEDSAEDTTSTTTTESTSTESTSTESTSTESTSTESTSTESTSTESTSTTESTSIDDEETTSTTTVESTTIASNPTIEWPTGPYKNVTVCNEEEVQSKEINSDIVFIFDESSSMCKYIDAMRNKLNNFITELDKVNANARFAIIGFGGEPRIYSPFTDDISEVQKAFAKLNCNEGGQESGLEAIRMLLNKSMKFINKVEDPYGMDSFEDVDGLEWRQGSTKTIILVTDEDSDLPIYEENMNNLQIENLKNVVDVESYDGEVISEEDAAKFIGFPYYLNKYNMPEYSSKVFFEPSFSPAMLTSVKNIYTFYRNASPLVLSPSYQKEVDDTAELLINENVQLFMLLNDNLADSQGSDVANSQFDELNPYWVKKGLIESDDSSTITAQYGNPKLDSLKKVAFDREGIYDKLVEKSQEKSLQGRILAKEGFCRAFNMKDFTTSESERMVELFYKIVVKTVEICKVVPVPIEETTTSEIETSTSSIEETTTSTETESTSSTTTEETTSSTTTEETTTTTTEEETEEPIEWPTGPYRNITVCNDEEVNYKEIDSDIVFIIDESSSMCKYITPLRKKLNRFMEALKKAKANARFAIIGFGGKPRIYSAFTDDVKSIEDAFGKLNCNESGQESGLEAIRMFINKSDKFINKIDNYYGEDNFEDVDSIEWRENSQKTIILVTDEDSDLPQYEENRNSLQIENLKNMVNVKELNEKDVEQVEQSDIETMMGFPYYANKAFMPQYTSEVYFEPSFSPAKLTSVNGIYTFYRTASPLVLSPSYQKEVDETAKLINSKNIQLFMLLNDNLADSQGADVANSQFSEKNPYWKKLSISEKDDSSTITAQYGNPLLDSFLKTEFQRDEIYAELVSKNQEKSLQGQILASQGFCRAFNMKEFTTGRSERMVELFYKNVVKTVTNCKIVPVPIEETTTTDIETSTSTLYETVTEETTDIETYFICY